MGTSAITWNRENLASPGATANPVRSADAPNNPNDVVNASGFTLPRAARLSAQLNVYNLTNADFLTWGSGASYLRPTNVVPPRIVRVGITLDW